VPAGESVVITRQVTYNLESYCGHEDLSNTMTATADVGNCVTCGAGTPQAACESTATIHYPRQITPGVKCEITADHELTISSYPTTVTYTVTATNTGDVAEKITVAGFITDSDPGVCVEPGATKQWTAQVTYDNSYAGHDPITYTATVSADAADCAECVCGSLSSSSTCQITLSFEKGFDQPGTGTPGYWKNHPEAWPVDEITIGGVTYTKSRAIQLLKTPERGDKTYTMFRGLVCAKLNVLIGNDPRCINDAIASADAWMAAYGPVGSKVHADSDAWKLGEPVYQMLDDYNNGKLCAPHRD
jgi:hypothetical protein